MKKIILAMILTVIAIAAAFTKPLDPFIRDSLEKHKPIFEQKIERNSSALNENKLKVVQLEDYLNRLDRRNDKDIIKPGKKYLEISKAYVDWQAEYVAALELEVEVINNMLETNEYDQRLSTINFGSIAERQQKIEKQLIEAQTKYNIAVRAHNLKN